MNEAGEGNSAVQKDLESEKTQQGKLSRDLFLLKSLAKLESSRSTSQID